MLLQESENKRRSDLRAILYSLASSQNFLENNMILEGIFFKLEEIYADGQFRHCYSDIYSIITDIDTNPEKGNLDILSQNMLYIKENIINNLSDTTKNSIRKLYDHTNLDISRINYIKSLQNRNFVAVFAFITVNSNITFELTQTNQSDVFWGIIKINGFVAICIFVLLVSLKFFVIKPLLGNEKESSK